jgi:minimal PKS acyl carrier protein
MGELSLGELVVLLRECAGEDEEIDLTGEIMDEPFDELGYDSLALFNTVGRLEREHGIRLPEDVVSEAKTPRALLREVNVRIGQLAER